VITYFWNPEAVFHETDSFFWLSQARQVVEFGSLPPSTLSYILAPLFYSTFLASFISFVGMGVSYLTIVRWLGPLFVMLVVLGWTLLLRSLNKKLSNLGLIFGLLVFFTSEWTLSFLLGGDLAPKAIGLFLLLVSMSIIFNKSFQSKRLSNLWWLISGALLLHYPDALFLFVPLTLAYPLSELVRDLYQKNHWLMFPAVFVGGRLLQFLVYVFMLGEAKSVLSSYSQVSYDTEYLISVFGWATFLTAILGLLVFALNKKEIRKTGIPMLVFLGFTYLALLYPGQFSTQVKALWQTHRNIVYFSIPLGVFSVWGFETLVRLAKKWKLLYVVLLIAIGFQLMLVAKNSLTIYASRIGPVHIQVGNKLPVEAREKLELVERDQDIHRKLIRVFSSFRNEVEGDSVYVQTNDEAAYYGISILTPSPIEVPHYPTNPRIYPWFSSNLKIVSHDVLTADWLVLDSSSSADLNLNNYQLFEEIEYLKREEFDLGTNEKLECGNRLADFQDEYEQIKFNNEGYLEWVNVDLLNSRREIRMADRLEDLPDDLFKIVPIEGNICKVRFVVHSPEKVIIYKRDN
jgi:hypothetical protein